MRVGLVSPYSYTYPGGVGLHVESLAEELIRQGHDVRMLAPYDPDDRLARMAHRGAGPQRREPPEYLIPLGFLGFVLCLVRWRTGSLYPCMGLHALNNSLALGINQLHWGAGGIVGLIVASALVIAGITGPLAARAPALA